MTIKYGMDMSGTCRHVTDSLRNFKSLPGLKQGVCKSRKSSKHPFWYFLNLPEPHSTPLTTKADTEVKHYTTYVFPGGQICQA